MTALLQPASPDAVAAAVLKMARSGLAYPPGLDARKAGDIYGFACKGIAIEALKRATMKIVSGKVEKISRDFIPTPASFAAIARSEANTIWADRARIVDTINSIRIDRPALPSAEAKERVRALNAAFQASAQAVREEDEPPERSEAELNHMFRNKLPPPPPGPSDGEYFRSIQQQEDIENGKEAGFSSEDLDQSGLHRGSEGSGNGDEGNRSVYGFEDGG